jgi:hypothetical protein
VIGGKVGLSSKDRTKALDELLKDITRMQVYVGVPQEKTGRRKPKINNAQLLFVHTNGSPLRGIPARPVIEPAIEAQRNKEAIAGELAAAAKSVLNGQPEEAKKHLDRAGQEGMQAAQDWFEDPRNGWAPNTPATIAAKGSDRPLVDTDQMRKAITYVVRDQG